MRRLGLSSLAGQLIAVMVLALLAAQVAGLVLYADDRRLTIGAIRQENLLLRTASVAQLLAAAPAELRPAVLDAGSSGLLRFRLDGHDAAAVAEGFRPNRRLTAQLLEALGGAGLGAATVAFRAADDDGWSWLDRLFRDRPGEHARRRQGEGTETHRRPRFRPPAQIVASVRLDDATWLNAEIAVPPPPGAWAEPRVLATLALAVVVGLVVVLLVRRMTRPLAALAEGADAIGRGGGAAPIVEAGPTDIRRTIRAFNRMNERLSRYLASRTRMLAAISHDLRTPITSLRLRAEFVEDEENRARMLETLDEMQRIAEAALDFAREEAVEEPRAVDLAALLQSLCDDLAGLGWPVACTVPDRAPCRCRPTSLRRALRNLIGNAVTYGARARVTMAAGDGEYRIEIDDDGPGIAPADQERVFEPFVRLEASRSRETGGVGLGLPIARSVARAHGGEVELANRPEGGLRATLRLPA